MLTFITGGQRSGKSSFAQKLALSRAENPVYLATARHWDREFSARIARHQADRALRWCNVEEEKHISRIGMHQRVVVLDCITLWLNNFFFDSNYDVDHSLTLAKKEWDAFTALDNQLIVISNEIGMGVIPEHVNARRFADLQGWMNQHIAAQAEEVYLMVAGIPVKLLPSC
jgi:adenosylcobinamide kinase / adenosylcobinamide-phosphate guanylyltransferase